MSGFRHKLIIKDDLERYEGNDFKDYTIFSSVKNSNNTLEMLYTTSKDDIFYLHAGQRKELFEGLLQVSLNASEHLVETIDRLLRSINNILIVNKSVNVILIEISFVLSHVDMSLLKKFLLHPAHLSKTFYLIVKHPDIARQSEHLFDHILKKNYHKAKEYLYEKYFGSTKASTAPALDYKKKSIADLVNLLYFILIAKKEHAAEKNLSSFYAFFSHHDTSRHIDTLTRNKFWFDLAQMLTKKEKNFSLALACYERALLELKLDSHISEEMFLFKKCVIDNGIALVHLFQGDFAKALHLELSVLQGLEGCQQTREVHTLLFQTLINISRMYEITKDTAQQEKYLMEAVKVNRERGLNFDSLVSMLLVKYDLKNGRNGKAAHLFSHLLESTPAGGSEVEWMKVGIELVNQMNEDDRKVTLLKQLALHLNGHRLQQIKQIRSFVHEIPACPSRDDALQVISQYISVIIQRNEQLSGLESLVVEKRAE